jgi:hypothetical protein
VFKFFGNIKSFKKMVDRDQAERRQKLQEKGEDQYQAMRLKFKTTLE